MFKYFLPALLIFTFIATVGFAETLTIGVLPGGDPKVTEKQSLKLAEKIQARIGRPVQVFISKNYGGLIDAIKNKKVDFAVFSAMTYVVAEKEVPIKVLLKKTWNNSPYYYSALISQSDSKIKKIADLKDKKIAFVDEKSTSGYMYPQISLRRQKIKDSDFKTISFSGSHAASIELLEKRAVDVVAVFADDEKGKNGAWTHFARSKKFKPRVIWISDPIPNDPIVVRQDFYEENTKLTHEVMYTLIDIQNQSQSELGDILGTSDLMPATARQYEPVREVYKTFQGVIKL
jgi:phosphonate transport system substrate-binding protein